MNDGPRGLVSKKKEIISFSPTPIIRSSFPENIYLALMGFIILSTEKYLRDFFCYGVYLARPTQGSTCARRKRRRRGYHGVQGRHGGAMYYMSTMKGERYPLAPISNEFKGAHEKMMGLGLDLVL